jgi:uncharacterized protein
MEVALHGIPFRLHPSGAVYWPQAQSLLLADLHLGKESVHQQAGLAIPSGASESTLGSLQTLVRTFAPKRVIVLGDLLHAKVGLTPWLEEQMVTMTGDDAGAEWILVPGNHDRGGVQALRRCGLRISQDRMQEQGVEMMHAPEMLEATESLTISGHLHPSIRIRLNARENTTLRCFWLHASQFILPAFGGWTGTKTISPKRGDRVFACLEQEVIELAV